jgi:hypothetical protein
VRGEASARCAVFYAVTKEGPLHEANGCLLVIKFVQQYGDEAHKKLADKKLAPTLHWCAGIPGGLRMVVMNQVNGKAVTEAGLGRQLPQPARDDVRCALDELYKLGRVFGDLRAPNVMLTGPPFRVDAFRQAPGTQDDDDEVYAVLIDFDWCGKEGEQRYPANINTKDDIHWHPEVKPGQTLRREHGEHMFERL